MKRRTLLSIIGVTLLTPVAYGGYYWLRYIRPGDAKPIVSAILDKHLGQLNIEPASRERFVQTTATKLLGSDRGTKALWLGMVAELYEHANLFVFSPASELRFRRLEDFVISSFVMGSDLLEKGVHADLVTYDGRERDCIGVIVANFA